MITRHNRGYVIDDVDFNRARGGVAYRVLHLIGERLTRHYVGPVVGTRRGFWRRGQGVSVLAVGIELNLPISPGRAALQGKSQLPNTTRGVACQITRDGFRGGRRIAASDRAGRQVVAVLDGVQRVFIHLDLGVAKHSWAAVR